MDARIEEIFKVTGVPTHTFVEPSEFGQLKVALRTSGRGVVVEGPSGIGKSTAVTKALEALELDKDVAKLSARNKDIAKLVHFSSNKTSSVEDPMLVYYLRAINWEDFIAEVGFTNVDYTASYEVALSFAEEDRSYAEHLRDALEDMGHAIFYDQAEQHRILAEDVEAYLGPIYARDCRYVVAVLGEMYGRKRWTLFEAEQYRDRIEQGQVIPLWSTKVPPTPFDESRRRGGQLRSHRGPAGAGGRARPDHLPEAG
jgi:hypothetical protein